MQISESRNNRKEKQQRVKNFMEIEDMQDYNRQPRVRKFIELGNLQQHTRHEGKTKDLRDQKKDQSKAKVSQERPRQKIKERIQYNLRSKVENITTNNINTEHLQQMLKQDVSQLNERTNESVMSVLTELPVPTTFDNGVQSIINIPGLIKEIFNSNNNNNNPKTGKQQAWIKGTVMVHHLVNVACVPHYQM